MGSFALATAAFVGAATVASVGRADAASTVVLLAPEKANASSSETMTRAKGELTAAGFHVVVTQQRGSDTRAALTEAMRTSSAVAAIAIEPSPGSTIVEVWVSDRLTGKLSIRPVETAGRGDTPALLAIRAVELLRASLIEIYHPPPGTAAPPAPPAVARLAAPRDADRSQVSFRSGFAVEAGATGLLATQPLTPAIAPTIRLSYGVDMGLGGRLTWIGPTAGPGITGALGQAAVTEELLLGELVFAPPIDAPVGWLVSAGAGFLHVDARGELDDPRRQRSGGATVFAATVGSGLDLRLDPHFAVSIGLWAGATAPAVVIDMADDEVATLGQPILGGSIGLVGVF